MRLMELISVVFGLVLILFTAHTYFDEKSVASHIAEGKPVVCRGAVLEKARLIRIGGELYVESEDVMYHIDECEPLPER